MNNVTDGQGAVTQAVAPAAEAHSAGTQLRLAREAALMTLDDVAQQLKLARRQVVALESDDVDALPGPTFVRGFIRNYARLLRIDAAPLIEASRLAMSPPAVAASSPQVAPTMSELPVQNDHHHGGGGAARWLIPTGLILLLAAGVAYYQFGGVTNPDRKGARKDAVEPSVPGTSMPDKTQAPPTALPATQSPGMQPISAPAAPVFGSDSTTAAAQAASAAAATPGAIPTATGDTPEGKLELEFGGPSWVEVRDKYGDPLISRTMAAKTRQTVTGELPFTLRIGNASSVRVVLDGRPIDLSPHTRNEIARLVLPAPQP